MWRNIFLTYAFLVLSAMGWARWTGYEFGDDAAVVWSQQGTTQYQHHK